MDFVSASTLPALGSGQPRRTPQVIKKVALEYTGFARFRGRSGTNDFESPEYNLTEIAKAEDTESIIATSFRKHVSAVLKEGWKLNGSNQRSVGAITRRLREIELAMATPWNQILRSLAKDLITNSNAFLILIRSEVNQPTGRNRRRRVVQGKILFPIVGVQTADPTSMRVKRDKHGNVERWQQWIDNVDQVQFSPRNVVHLYYNRRTGFAFAAPWILSALDDIRALRRLEELAEVVTHKHAFPLFHFKVGTPDEPASEFDDGSSEVDDVKVEIESMPVEGALVTSERVTTEIIGVNGEVMDLVPLLMYWRERAAGGVNLSLSDIGIVDTGNKATVIQASRNLVDLAKEFQTVLCDFINFVFIAQLLEEEGFALSEENMVFLTFPEIDIERRQVIENHATDLFLKNGLTHDEMRAILSKEPMTDEQVQDTNLHKFEIPKLKAQAEAAAKAKAQFAPPPAAGRPAGGKAVANKNRPTNQNGTKPARTTPANDMDDRVPLLPEMSALFLGSISELWDHALDQLIGEDRQEPEAVLDALFNQIRDHIGEVAKPLIDQGMQLYASKHSDRTYYVGQNVVNYYLDRCVGPTLEEVRVRMEPFLGTGEVSRTRSVFDTIHGMVDQSAQKALDLAKPYGWLKAAQIDKKETILGQTESGPAALSVFDINHVDLLVLAEMFQQSDPVPA